MTRTTTRRLPALIAALLAGLLVLAGQSPLAGQTAEAAETRTTTVAFTATTTVRGTPDATFYEGAWSKSSTHTWASDGAAFEIAFTGETVALSGRKATTNGTADVFVDGVKIGSADYRGARSTTTVPIASFTGLAPGDHVLRVVTVGFINHASAEFTSTVLVDERARLAAALDRVGALGAPDFTASSWAPFSAAVATATAARDDAGSTDAALLAARSALETAETGLVRISGLRERLDEYRTRVPSAYTAASWAPFAAATVSAGEVLDDSAASAAAVVAAKNGLQTTAAALVPLADGTLQTVENNRFWLDTAGDPIFSQGGGIFRFGDRYYWYGVEYTGSQLYYDSPTRTYTRAGEGDFVAVTAYSSEDLVNWTFENDVATKDTALHIPASKDVTGTYFSDMDTLADAVWIGRLGVAYNEQTGKYVLLTQFESPDPARVTNAGVLFLSGDSPVADFEYANLQTHIPGVYRNPSKPGWEQGTGDQTVFTDDDGADYLVFSYRDGRSRTYVGRISDTDSLSVETAVEVYRGAGREGNAMFKLDGQYYVASSDLHGWNTSQTYLVRSLEGRIQGPYSSMYVLPGTEKDYSHVTQSGFFLTVQGTEQDTVIYAGDRWADFAWNGLGYNQWLPLSGTGADVRFNSLSEWDLNARSGEWQVGAGNNWILNPDFAADRIPVTTVTGWTQTTDASSTTTGFVSNPSPGADGSRFALRLGAAQAFSGGVQQQNDVPAGVYTLSLRADRPGGLDSARIVVTGADGVEHRTEIPATSGWADVRSAEFSLPAGTTTVAILASGPGGGSLTVDALALRRQAAASWSAGSVYRQSDTVLFQGSLWRASWWTSNQTPGDPNGPWQQLSTAPDGTAVWTASRIFDTGDVVVHQGQRYRAKWWTRNQAPGDPYGPWQPLG
ncbi:carbohydrate-binding protein [Rathayibacter sp. VKM Ac-2857]|uniref:carbohydrate-binding protein n=1 Tax=Rathayibacter sp. VKM Ac-2857 TaxID=2739020 RepID=UPI001563E8AF|nr:carbohydrate-binding protein [Rathayibacter sp. VKM Ac-2857]NQX15727.1 family 43 glycosylhydrolase [Rathayibacter sp. VKM Ac-2857]